MNNENFIEQIAELEHEQWMEWSKNIAKKEKLSSGRMTQWKELWIPYSELSEEVKEQDRKWARKVIQKIGEECEENHIDKAYVERCLDEEKFETRNQTLDEVEKIIKQIEKKNAEELMGKRLLVEIQKLRGNEK